MMQRHVRPVMWVVRCVAVLACGPVGTTGIQAEDGPEHRGNGAPGDLLCLDSKTGEVLWKKNYLTDYHARTEQWPAWWGFSSPPLVDGDRLICLVGGYPDAGVVAFDKRTGKELWRSVSGEFAPG